MRESSSAVPPDGRSRLEASLEAALSDIGPREVVDLMIAGWTGDELVRVVATTPPFSSAIAEHIQRHLLAVVGR